MTDGKLYMKPGDKDDYGWTLIERSQCFLDIWESPKKRKYKICIPWTEKKGYDICEFDDIEKAKAAYKKIIGKR